MKKVSFKVKNKKWILKFMPSMGMSRYSYGECDYPDVAKPQIWVNKNLNEKDMINTIIHEVLHAVRPELCEESVEETANVLEEVLIKAGVKIDLDLIKKSGEKVNKTQSK